MKPHNAENERLKRRYFAYLREAKRYSEASVDMVAKALHRFETYAPYARFQGLSHRADDRLQETPVGADQRTNWSQVLSEWET